MNSSPAAPDQKKIGFKKLAVAFLIGIVTLIVHYGFYLGGHYLAEWFGFTPFLPKIALDDKIPMLSIFIIPYVWSYAYWAIASMVIYLKCERKHFYDYMAANLIACFAGMLFLAFFPTYMDRVAEGLFEATENPNFFDKLREFWYGLDGSKMAYNLLPSFHCLNSMLCYLGVMGKKNVSLGYRIYSLVMSLLIFASTVFVKQHYFLDILAGAGLAALAYFLCKQFHLGRMFAPIDRFFAKRAKKREDQ